MKKHKSVDMIKDSWVEIVVDKYTMNHNWRNGCACNNVVFNLMGGRRIWTKVKFDCGEVVKINCNSLKVI